MSNNPEQELGPDDIERIAGHHAAMFGTDDIFRDLVQIAKNLRAEAAASGEQTTATETPPADKSGTTGQP